MVKKHQAVVVSDVHIGTGAPTVWYQQSVHEPYLKAILNWVIENASSITELILLGDIFDFWTYPPDVKPPSLRDIIAANPNILGRGGLLNQVMTALDGAVTLILGNHDGTISAAELDDLRTEIGPIKLGDSVYTLAGSTGLRTTFAHGHTWTMFNAPDPRSRWGTLPVGHFITRAVAYQMAKQLKPGQTVADLQDQGAPNGLDISKFLHSLSYSSKDSIVRLLLDYISKVTGIDPSMPICMLDGSVSSINEAKEVYADLFDTWAAQYGGEWQATRAAVADQWGEYLAWFAQRLALETGSDLVVFGHTHTPIGGLDPSPVNYVNSGFECPSLPDMPNKGPTFVVIDLDAASPQIFHVNHVDGEYKINYNYHAPSISPIPPLSINPPSSGRDNSCYCSIYNQSSQPLVLQALPEPTNGTWVVPPPQEVPPASVGRFWLQDKVGASGSEGSVSYKQGSKTLEFSFSCPMGVFSNKVSTNAFKFSSRVGSGDWQDGSVASLGHPLQLKFIVRDPRHAAPFSNTSCGNITGVATATDECLLLGEQVAINGSTDLSTCIVGNSGACVYSITLQPNAGFNSYVLNVVAKGPKGPGSGWLNLWFTDQTGDKYKLGILDSNKKQHTVSYDSNKPGIVKIEWSD